MDSYFPTIFAQNIVLCLVITIFVYRNTFLHKREKFTFYITLALGILIALCEVISTATNGRPDCIFLQNAVDYCSLALTPLLPAIPVISISGAEKIHIPCLVFITVNIVFLISGQIFYVDSMGNYTRNSLFWVFILCSLSNMVILTLDSLIFSWQHQNHNVAGLLFISLFMISSTSIQLRHPEIHFSWFCVTVTVMLYFFYYTDVIQQTDSLTGLLNRSAFNDYSFHFKRRIDTIVMIDFDDFKTINDTYGHLVGDRYLSFFGHSLRKIFGSNGNCYRLGGDEFCILITTSSDYFSLKDALHSVEDCCKKAEGLPNPFSFSYGYQHLEKDMTIDEAIDIADHYMYQRKTDKKNKRK